jgi:hypothetical protein
MRVPNHNLTHDTSEKPSELPTTTSSPPPRALIRLEMQPHVHEPQLKVLKHLSMYDKDMLKL